MTFTKQRYEDFWALHHITTCQWELNLGCFIENWTWNCYWCVHFRNEIHTVTHISLLSQFFRWRLNTLQIGYQNVSRKLEWKRVLEISGSFLLLWYVLSLQALCATFKVLEHWERNLDNRYKKVKKQMYLITFTVIFSMGHSVRLLMTIW